MKNYSQDIMDYAHFCIYNGNIISPLQHHLSANNITYIETERFKMCYLSTRSMKVAFCGMPVGMV